MISNPSNIVSPLERFHRRASSFAFASAFFRPEVRRPVVALYDFLRTTDDMVDDDGDAAEALNVLNRWKEAIDRGEFPDTLCASIRTAIDRGALEDFLEGQRSDATGAAISSEDELMLYCYRVAGTVGVLLCGILGVKNSHALRCATRLGMAMQLTNIARDLVEDARRGRTYLPTQWVSRETIAEAVNNTGPRGRIEEIILRLLQTAEELYTEAAAGMRYLHPRDRFAIMFASRLYRQIGRKIVNNPERVWTERVHLNAVEKSTHLIIAAAEWLASLPSRGTGGVGRLQEL